MIKILVVVPYRELQDAFEEVITTFEHDGIHISTTHILGTDPQVIKDLDGDIIVARGITASAIATYRPTTHVIPIALGNGDLLTALSLAKQQNKTCNIGIITNEELCESEKIACKTQYRGYRPAYLTQAVQGAFFTPLERMPKQHPCI